MSHRGDGFPVVYPASDRRRTLGRRDWTLLSTDAMGRSAGSLFGEKANPKQKTNTQASKQTNKHTAPPKSYATTPNPKPQTRLTTDQRTAPKSYLRLEILLRTDARDGDAGRGMREGGQSRPGPIGASLTRGPRPPILYTPKHSCDGTGARALACKREGRAAPGLAGPLSP